MLHRTLLPGLLTCLVPLTAAAHYGPDPVGLSILFQNGAAAPITLIGNAPRYIQELDIAATKITSTDQGIQPLIEDSDFSHLDWTGVQLVEEDWRPDGMGTFTRQRFYRGARWMERASLFMLFPTTDSGFIVGLPLIAYAGTDNNWSSLDDGFVRRFDARQITLGCPAIGDCTGATTYIAQGLVQLRNAMHANQRSFIIPPWADSLTLVWTEDLAGCRTVFVDHASPSEFPYGYGLEVSLEEITTPANGQYYTPGEQVSFRVTYRDGDGNRLHPEGSLPTYGEFVRGEIESGIRYFDSSLTPTLYYAFKHREGNSAVTLSGPTNKLRTPETVVDLPDFFQPQVVTASVAVDGFTGLSIGVPPGGIVLGGLIDPSVWETPISDVVTFTIPEDALPGTYVAAFKARRVFAGEALNRGTTAEIQVGSANPTSFTPKTGKCNNCHTGPSALGEILHGIEDRRSCFACHGGLSFEPDAYLDYRVHAVHDRSDRFPGNVKKCNTCHLTTPSGPARGFLP